MKMCAGDFPVSYTHLDVYKRQLLLCLHDPINYIIMFLIAAGVAFAPVSYTHLDVYKRQIQFWIREVMHR